MTIFLPFSVVISSFTPQDDMPVQHNLHGHSVLRVCTPGEKTSKVMSNYYREWTSSPGFNYRNYFK